VVLEVLVLELALLLALELLNRLQVVFLELGPQNLQLLEL
jgi:hypothetical protein